MFKGMLQGKGCYFHNLIMLIIIVDFLGDPLSLKERVILVQIKGEYISILGISFYRSSYLLSWRGRGSSWGLWVEIWLKTNCHISFILLKERKGKERKEY